MNPYEEPDAPMRGIVLGVLIGCVFWYWIAAGISAGLAMVLGAVL